VQPRQDDVGFRASHIAQHPEDFDVHRFRGDAFEYGIRHTVHASLDLVLGHDLNFGFFGREAGQRTEAE
jgi:hypothetical protein